MIITSASKNQKIDFDKGNPTNKNSLLQAFVSMRNNLRNDLKDINKIKWE